MVGRHNYLGRGKMVVGKQVGDNFFVKLWLMKFITQVNVTSRVDFVDCFLVIAW